MRNVVVIGGPTASGKSGLAVALAQHFDGVVINADALQTYNALPILTAQPDAADRAAAEHVLYGVVEPAEKMSAQSWRGLAEIEINRAHAAHRLPIVAGGTGFYLQALLQGMSPIPEIPAEVRAQAQAVCDEHGVDALYARLVEKDPAGASRLDAKNPQRLVRAYEVLLHTGKPISHWQDAPRNPPPAGWRFHTIVLAPPREDLHRNCENRIGTMMKNGLLDEVAGFMRSHADDTALGHACGYAPLKQHLLGSMPLDQALEAMLIDTRQYARRQQTWFRNQLPGDTRLESADAGAAIRALGDFKKQ